MAGEMASRDPTAVLGLLQGLLSGGKTKTTTKSNISQAGFDAALKGLLESDRGLASVASGQRTAGLYNSSTNQLLVNDLITRATGQVEQLRAGQTQTVQAPTLDPSLLLGLSAVNKLTNGKGLEGLKDIPGNLKKGIDPLLKTLGLGGDAAVAGGAAVDFATAGDVFGAGTAGFGGLGGAGNDLAAGAVNAFSAFDAGSAAADAASLFDAGAAVGNVTDLGTVSVQGAAETGAADFGGALGTAASALSAFKVGDRILSGDFFQGKPLEKLGDVAGVYAIFSLLSSALSFSDERLKTDVKEIGEAKDGTPIYSYRYIGDPRTQFGVMAQEVEKFHPEAVMDDPATGFKKVNYGILSAKIAGL